MSLFFLSLPNAENAIARVAERVRQGGHNVPESVIRSGIRNFRAHYRQAVSDWVLYDSSGVEPVLLEWGENE